MDNNETGNQSMKFPRWAAIVLCASLILNVVMYNNFKSMKQDISNLQNNIGSLSNSVNSTISSNISQISDMLKRESSLVAEFTYEFVDYKDKRVDFLLKLKPKTYSKGQKLYFSCKTGDDSAKLIEAKSIDNVNFTAKVNMSIFDNMDIDLVIDEGTTKSTEKLDSIYSPAEKFTAQLNANSLGGSMSYDRDKSVLETTYQFELVDYKADMKEYTLGDVKLVVEVGGKTIGTMPILRADDEGVQGERYYIELKGYEIPCKTGDVVKVYIKASDNKGFNYKALVLGGILGEDGSFDSSPVDKDMGMDIGRVEVS